MDLIRHPIVFLHLPRTGGGAVHAALARVVGTPRVSPVRSADQAAPGAAQFPPGHALYSGPLDWDGIEALPRGRFTFTVLRDPQERIASLYLHFRALADALTDATEVATTAQRAEIAAIPAHDGLAERLHAVSVMLNAIQRRRDVVSRDDDDLAFLLSVF